MPDNKKVSTLRIVILICAFIAYLALFYFTPDLETNNWFLKGFISLLWGFAFVCLSVLALFLLNVTETSKEQEGQKTSLIWHTIPSIVWLEVNTIIATWFVRMIVYNFRSIPKMGLLDAFIVFSPLAIVYICYLGIKKQYAYIKNITVFMGLIIAGCILGIMLFSKYLSF